MNRSLLSVGKRCVRLILLGLALLALPFIRLARPWFLVRWLGLRSERIGHFLEDPEVYCGERALGWVEAGGLDLFYHGGKACNRQAEKLVRRLVTVTPAARYLAQVNRWFPGGDAHEIKLRYEAEGAGHCRHKDGVYARAPVSIHFADAENRRGWEQVRAWGLGDEFICCLARDPAYLAASFPERGDVSGFYSYRDCDIDTYIPAMTWAADRGYGVLRMGAATAKRLSLSHPRVLDYATRCRDEFMDIWLPAHCRFFLSSGAGLDGIANVFRRPVAYVNMLPMASIFSHNPADIGIPKLLVDRSTGNPLLFREVVARELAWAQLSDDYRRAGVEWMDNTPDEILELAAEMDDRLRGVWRNEPGDQELIDRFWHIFRPDEAERYVPSRVGVKFLRRHEHLLN
jgi:putative glycosyltransferase (TIGR04372 family)